MLAAFNTSFVALAALQMKLTDSPHCAVADSDSHLLEVVLETFRMHFRMKLLLSLAH